MTTVAGTGLTATLDRELVRRTVKLSLPSWRWSWTIGMLAHGRLEDDVNAIFIELAVKLASELASNN